MLEKLTQDYNDLLARCVELEEKYKELNKSYDKVLAQLKELQK